MNDKLWISPITLKEARVFVDRHHRHHRAPQGGLFAIGAAYYADVIGVVIVGRPVSRHQQDGWTAEVTRLAVLEGHKNACSMLYGAAWRATKALGWKRLITYTLKSEKGTSVKAAGWQEIGVTAGGSWSTPSRPRIDKHPLEQKVLWEKA